MNSTASTYPRSSRRVAKKQPAKPKKRVAPSSKTQTAPRFSDWFNTDHPALPGWQDIQGKTKGKNKKNPSAKRNAATFEQISTPKFAIYTFLAVLLMSLYVSHVFATQKALTALEDVRRQNLQLTLEYNQKKASFDNMVRPDQVYHRAKELGFTEGIAFGPPVLWKPELAE